MYDVYSKTMMIAIASLLMLSGCGKQGLPQVRVSGKVSYDGAEMPGPGTIFFTPVSAAEGLPTRPAVADFGIDGKYNASSFGKGGGLVPGTYRVAVHCWESEMTMASGQTDSFIPMRYTSAQTSELELIVPKDESSLTWDIPLLSTKNR